MGYPVLAAQYGWYRTTRPRSYFTKIRFVNSYEPENVDVIETWNADEADTGSIKCYVVGTELIICGNGMIAANPDSSYMFGPKVTSVDNIQTFVNVTHVYGAELIDMSNVTTLERAFCYSLSLEYMNTSEWVLKNVKSIEYLFGV